MVITTVLSGTSQNQAARQFQVSQSWVCRLMARYRLEGEAAFQPRSTRPRTNPNATPPELVDHVLRLRRELTTQGLDAGADTIAWHLQRAGQHLSRTTIHRILTREGVVIAQPAKRPKVSYTRFEAELPNQCWQSDFTHYRLTSPHGQPGADVELITWLDDHSRYVLHLSAHHRITAPVVAATFTTAATHHGWPASTLTDNGMVYTVRLAGQGRRGGRTQLEALLAAHHIQQKNGSPGHPQTQGKVERFQQTLKKWLTAQPVQPATITQLQALLDTFVEHYNHHRPHRALPHRATPATAYTTRPKATPQPQPPDPHRRYRTDRVDKTGALTLRVNGRLHHIGIGRTHSRTCVRILVNDLQVTIINATTGEILRELTIDPTRDYQPLGTKQKPEPSK